MPEPLTTSTSPQLTPPVNREPISTAAEPLLGAETLMWSHIPGAPPFADDDAE